MKNNSKALSAALKELDRLSKGNGDKEFFAKHKDRIAKHVRQLYDIDAKGLESAHIDDFSLLEVKPETIATLRKAYKIKDENLLSALIGSIICDAIDKKPNETDSQIIARCTNTARRHLLLKSAEKCLPVSQSVYNVILTVGERVKELHKLKNFFRSKTNLVGNPSDFPSHVIGDIMRNLEATFSRFIATLSNAKSSDLRTLDSLQDLNSIFCVLFREIDRIKVLPQTQITLSKYIKLRDTYEERPKNWKRALTYLADQFLDEFEKISYAFAEAEGRINIFDEDVKKYPIDANIVSVAPSAGKGLRAAMKDPGGRPKKTHGGAKVMTQAEMAAAFGSPCNESMVANWEARAAGKKRGANPPDAIYNDERIIYSAELRLNPTPDNKNRLSALIAEFQSRHRIKGAIGKKALHMKSAETLAKASGQVAAAIRDQSHLKYGK